jgi:hypothetical protein
VKDENTNTINNADDEIRKVTPSLGLTESAYTYGRTLGALTEHTAKRSQNCAVKMTNRLLLTTN